MTYTTRTNIKRVVLTLFYSVYFPALFAGFVYIVSNDNIRNKIYNILYMN